MIAYPNIQAALRDAANNSVFTLVGSGAPVNGTTGSGVAGPGSFYLDTGTGNLYLQIGTLAASVWQLISATAVSGAGGDLSLRARFTVAQLNAGATILPAIAGWKYRMLEMSLIAIGGAATTATSVRITGTQAAGSVVLMDAPVAGLTRSTLLVAGFAGGTILADGASFAQCDANTPILLANNGAAMTVLTNIDVILSYQIEK